MTNLSTLSKSRRQIITYGAATLGGSLLLSACGGGGDDKTVATQVDEAKSVMNQAEAKPECSIFVEAVKACGLASTLDDSGTVTAFAFTNDGFNATLAELNVSKDQLFADKTTLTAIVKCHIMSKAQFTEAIVEGHTLDTIGGGFFKIDKENNVFTATDGRNRQCKLISTDVVALNGVLHTVDKTMLPANMDIIVTCQEKPEIKPQCDIAVKCIEACGLTDSLKQPGTDMTFICPTDAAFQAVFIELNITIDILLADIPRCKKIMQCHQIPKRKCKKEFEVDQPVTTVQGTTIKVNSSYQIVDVRGRICNLTTPDVLNTNGVLHVCDKVILPADA
jgi:uncharacterized surface protein with fasciclin (FAS1) repeats